MSGRAGWFPVPERGGLYVYASFVPDRLEFLVGNGEGGGWVFAGRSLDPDRSGFVSRSFPTAEEAMIACEEWRARRDWDALP
jgi:hypothetical protein